MLLASLALVTGALAEEPASAPTAIPSAAPTRAAAPAAPPEEELTMPTLSLERVPPRQSYDLALQISYGQVAYFRDTVPPWIGFGLRGAWGRNTGLHRFGAAALVAAEGDVGVHTYLSLEPSVTWDFVSRGDKGGVQLGAGVGPALGYVVNNDTVETERSFEVAPAAGLRIGYSQGWTRVGRRLFVLLEPKVRVADDGPSGVVALVVGSGGGR